MDRLKAFFHFLGPLWVIMIGLLIWSQSRVEAAPTNRIFAVQSRVSTPAYQLFLALLPDSGAAYSGPLYGPPGGVYGMTFHGDTLYGVELDNGGVSNFLATIPYEGASIGQGSRVSTNQIGFPNVESLAVADDVVYATSLDFAGHRSQLLTIDPVTGVGSLVGTTGTDIMLVGLAFDPFQQILYGAGIPFATVSEANLYSVNRFTGAATVIGPLGVEIQSLSWDVTLGLIGSFAKLYQIDSQTGLATQIGTNDFTAGMPATYNGIYALASYVPTNTVRLAFTDISSATGEVSLTWASVAGVTYRMDYRNDLTVDTWSDIGSNIVASSGTTTHVHAGGTPDSNWFYRVRSVPTP